jgi:guanine nucleotide-binding protein subunit alpha
LPQVIIFSNMLDSLKAILEAMETYDLTFDRSENEVYSSLLQKA